MIRRVLPALAATALLAACVAPAPLYVPIYVMPAEPPPPPIMSYPLLPPLPPPTPSVDDLATPGPAAPAPLPDTVPDPVPQVRDEPRPAPPPPIAAVPESAVPMQGFRPMRPYRPTP